VTTDSAQLFELLSSSLNETGGVSLGVAVSGGGDSIALLHVAAQFAKCAGITLYAVTVDHGLRAASAKEAQFVADVCTQIGVHHDVLTWACWDGTGNLQDQARRARYSLITDWAQRVGVSTVLLAHTADDQAETFLMRLARGAGVDGLSGMVPQRKADGITWSRPFLAATRQQLRNYLTVRDLDWIDDPSNEDTRFDRIKARKVLAALQPLGIDVELLSAVTGRLSQARKALEAQTLRAARDLARIEHGDVIYDLDKLQAQSPEIRRRLLSHAVKWVSSAEYGPRGPALTDLSAKVFAGEQVTLHGCILRPEKQALRIHREAQAVRNEVAEIDEVWDGRWCIKGNKNINLTVRLLGENGLNSVSGWRETSMPRTSLLASPAVWEGQALVAAPLADLSSEWRVELVLGEEHFFKSIISH
jgi:tRNA(Ile)-lysidine synthase